MWAVLPDRPGCWVLACVVCLVMMFSLPSRGLEVNWEGHQAPGCCSRAGSATPEHGGAASVSQCFAACTVGHQGQYSSSNHVN